MVRMVKMDARVTLVIGVTRERKVNAENVENAVSLDVRVNVENVERKVTMVTRVTRETKEIVGKRVNEVKEEREVTMDVTGMMVTTVVMERKGREENVVKEGVLVRMVNQVTDGLRLQDTLSVLDSVLET